MLLAASASAYRGPFEQGAPCGDCFFRGSFKTGCCAGFDVSHNPSASPE
jgi:hypothetical protein